MNNNVYKRYQNGDKILEIIPDDTGESPREWDNIGKMVCSHRRYRVPNELNVPFEELGSWDEVEEWICTNYDVVAIYSMYMLDHGGVRLSIGSFHDPWDSGQIGFIVATREDLLKAYGKKRMTKKIRENAWVILKEEVNVLDHYMAGNVYGYRTYAVKRCGECGHDEEDEEDSCWGFYGDDFKENGLFEMAGIKDIDEWEEIE